ncbi:hypothetical protein, partial [Streptococcus pneumoniae]|uniref:hypothetical protein n=1 Tax=Streptococcus pneumoniae TaxID=1313 RepID=UPI001E29D4AD
FQQYTGNSSHPNISGKNDTLNSGFASPGAFQWWPATCAAAPNCPGQYFRNFLQSFTSVDSANGYFGYQGSNQSYTGMQLL